MRKQSQLEAKLNGGCWDLDRKIEICLERRRKKSNVQRERERDREIERQRERERERESVCVCVSYSTKLSIARLCSVKDRWRECDDGGIR